MRRLVCHIGTHKTASTSFQRICRSFKEDLKNHQIYYPDLIGYPQLNNHAPIAWLLDAWDNYKLQAYLDELFQREDSKNCDTTLLSSEDFENILINHQMLDKLIHCAEANGFDAIELAVVSLKPLVYLETAYKQMSRHGAVLNYVDIALSSARTGYFCATTPQHNYQFAIRALDLAKNLSKKYPKIKIYHFTFEKFIQGFPGKTLLNAIAGQKLSEQISSCNPEQLYASRPEAENDDLLIEIQYAANCIGVDFPLIDKSESLNQLIHDIANKRISNTEQARLLAMKLFT